MIQIKKTILTLVALLAVTTGAWADETPLLTIESKDYTSFTSGSMTFDDMVTVTFSNKVYNDGDEYGWYTTNASLLTVAGTNGYTITSCKFYTDQYIAANGYNVDGVSPSVYLSFTGGVYTDDSKSLKIGEPGVTKIEVYGTAPSASSATAVDIAWDGATKTGTFTQPAGNVTVSVEYYPLATLAFQGLTAAEDAAAKTEAPLAVVADGAVTGGTLMYYVAPDKNFSQADAIALAETQWSAAIPTAETVEAAGTCYVWYYIKGDDEHSDTDPVPLVVTVLPEPTYAVEFAEGTPESDKWTADPAAGVKKGQTVTVTYSGSKKVIGVKAEKKAKAPASTPLDNTTTAWTAGTYAVPAGGLTYSDAITVSGDVTLVLTDGETLTLNKGISLAEGATLTVEGNGTMNVNGTNGNTSSTAGGNHGTLVLTSGTLTARGGNGGSVGDDESDAHGGNGGVAINGSVIVSDGTLTARGGNGGSVGNDSWDCTAGNGGDAISGTLTINGGSTSVNDGSNGSLGSDGINNTAGTGGKAVAGTVTDNR